MLSIIFAPGSATLSDTLLTLTLLVQVATLAPLVVKVIKRLVTLTAIAILHVRTLPESSRPHLTMGSTYALNR